VVLAVVDDERGRRIDELRSGLMPSRAKELNTRF
jgi:hypothetical protein